MLLGGFPPLPVATSRSDRRQSVGARFLQETDVFSSLADNKVLFVFVEIYIQKFMRDIHMCWKCSVWRIVGSPPKHFGDWCSHTSGS